MSKPANPLLVVALGASAGGLAALQQFFRSLPPSCKALAFVVVQHLSPEHKSVMKELLERTTDIPIQVVTAGMQLVANGVFLMPAGFYLDSQDACLSLSQRSQRHLPIDHFFQSLAQDVGDRAVAMIFSGTGSDGSHGLLAVKEAGGLVLVQDEASAEYADMPHAAIETGAADFVLTPTEMAQELASYVEHRAAVDPHVGPTDWSTDSLFETLLAKTGINFSEYKNDALLRRVRHRMAVRQMRSLANYTELLGHDPLEVKLLTHDLLIGATRFFRDPAAFEELAQQVVQPLLEAQTEKELRIWVPGCSTGEEVYSLLMLFHERAANLGRPCNLKVFATDLDGDALQVASLGCYNEGIAADISAARLERFFTSHNGGYQIDPALREQVVFSKQNLAQDPPLTGLDLVSCRNLMIYFESALRKRVLSFIHFSLVPAGFLFVGASESTADVQDSFTVVDLKARLYQKLGISPSLYRWPIRNDVKLFKERPDPARRLARAVDQGYRQLLEEHCPPSILVDQAGQVVHVFVVADHCLKIPAGAVRLGLTDLLPAKLAPLASGALFRAFQDRPTGLCDYPEILIESPDNAPAFALKARPLPNPLGKSEYALITFRPVSGEETVDQAAFVKTSTLHPEAQDEILSLRLELAQARAGFQTTVEELETTNEELQAIGEELSSTSQEHQTTGDQLRQALNLANEEFFALTSEHQIQMEELIGRIADLELFLTASQAAALFLDQDLNILHATSGILQYYPVRESDVGRPIGHFTPNFLWPGFLAEARRVAGGAISAAQDLRTQSDETPFRMVLASFQPKHGSPGVMVSFVRCAPTGAVF